MTIWQILLGPAMLGALVVFTLVIISWQTRRERR